jgi:ABC-2 type transport system permease protein
MKMLWYIAKKDLFQVLKDRNSALLLLVVPVILVSILGAVFSNDMGGNAAPTAFTVAVSNQDDGLIGETLIKALQAKNESVKITLDTYRNAAQVMQQVSEGNAVVGLVIPAQITNKVNNAAQNGQTIQNIIQLYAAPNNTDQRILLTQQIVTNVLNRQVDALYTGSAAAQQVSNALQQIRQTVPTKCRKEASAPAGREQVSSAKDELSGPNANNNSGNCDLKNSAVNLAAISKAVGEASPTTQGAVLVELRPAGNAPKISAFDRSMPGFAILFALFGLNTAAASLLQEKDDGTFRRLLIAPVPRYALLGGKLVTQFVLTLAQLTLLFTIAFLVFKLDLGSWQLIALLLVSTSVATTGLGMLLVSLLKSRRQLPALVTLTTLITSTIGGAWWPLWTEPQWMQQLAKLGVTAWALEGLNGVMIFGKGFDGIKFDIFGLLGYGAICFLLALRLFRFQEKGAPS